MRHSSYKIQYTRGSFTKNGQEKKKLDEPSFLKIRASSSKISSFSLGTVLQAFFSRNTGLDWRPETMAFREEKFLSTRSSCAMSTQAVMMRPRVEFFASASTRTVEMTR